MCIYVPVELGIAVRAINFTKIIQNSIDENIKIDIKKDKKKILR